MHVSAERRSLHGVINPFASTNILERALNCPLSPRARVYATNRGKSPHRVSRRRTRFRKLPTKFVSKFEVVKESRRERERERETFFFSFNTFNAHIRFTTRTIALKFYGEMEKKKGKGIFHERCRQYMAQPFWISFRFPCFVEKMKRMILRNFAWNVLRKQKS